MSNKPKYWCNSCKKYHDAGYRKHWKYKSHPPVEEELTIEDLKEEQNIISAIGIATTVEGIDVSYIKNERLPTKVFKKPPMTPNGDVTARLDVVVNLLTAILDRLEFMDKDAI